MSMDWIEERCAGSDVLSADVTPSCPILLLVMFPAGHLLGWFPTLKMETVHFSKISVDLCQNTRCHIQEDDALQAGYCLDMRYSNGKQELDKKICSRKPEEEKVVRPRPRWRNDSEVDTQYIWYGCRLYSAGFGYCPKMSLLENGNYISGAIEARISKKAERLSASQQSLCSKDTTVIKIRNENIRNRTGFCVTSVKSANNHKGNNPS